MHFGLTDEQLLLQESVRRYASELLPPNRLRALFDAGRGFDAGLWEGAAKLGLCGLLVPEEQGGAGLSLLDQALVCEVLGESAMPGPFLAHALVCRALVSGGSRAQQTRWLPGLASGERIGGVAFAEQGGDWAPERWQMDARGGRVSGRKRFAHAGPECGLVLVGLAGGRLGLVDPTAGGVSFEAAVGNDRTRAICDVVLSNAEVELLPPEGALASQVQDAARVLLAADAFGVAWRLIRVTVAYALQREQFDTPIAQFQAVKHQLADMAMEVEPMRGLVWYAAYAQDHLPLEAAREAAIVKAHVTDRAVDVARAAVSLHGGIGFTWECDVHFWLKRAMFDRTWAGGPALERERLARLAGY